MGSSLIQTEVAHALHMARATIHRLARITPTAVSDFSTPRATPRWRLLPQAREIARTLDMPTSAITPIGLADSELIQYSRTAKTFIVLVRAWNEQILLFEFDGVLAVREMLAGDFSDLVEDFSTNNNLLEGVLARNYSQIPTDHPYRSYTFLDNEGEPALEIVAKSSSARLSAV